jgi:hypothetical protein
MSFSALAWSGFARYFTILEKIHYTRPIRWNSKTKCLEVNPSPQKLFWSVGTLCSFIVGIACPVYVGLEQVFVGRLKLSMEEGGALLIVYFWASVHTIPVFLHTLLISKKDLVQGFNNIVKLEKHVFGICVQS